MANPELSQVSEKQRKRDDLAKYLYILPQLGASAPMSFFASYLPMLLTDIFMIPVALSGTIELLKSFVAWVGGPIVGVFLDRNTFKMGKYWQFMLFGGLFGQIFYVTTFVLPSKSDDPSSLALFVGILVMLISLTEIFSATAGAAVYPRLAEDPNTRAILAVEQKVGRDGGKSIWGLIVPALIISFTASSGSQAGAWASTAYIVGSFAVVCGAIYALILKGSSVEKNAQKEKEAAAGKKKPKVPLSEVFKGVVTNRALLAMFLFLTIHKIYYFFHVMTAAYFFTYVVQDFAKIGVFMTTFTLSAVAGALCGVFWKKIFKDSKRSFVASGVAHIVILGLLTLTYKNLSSGMFVVFIGGSSFFAGLIEAYMMPMFAAAADWSAWKTGARSDGLIMAVYSLSVQVGVFLSTAIRTALLAAAGYDGAAYAQGAVPSEAVINTLGQLQTLYPFIFAIICFGIVALFYPITDKKLVKIQEEIAAGRVGDLRNEDAITSV